MTSQSGCASSPAIGIFAFAVAGIFARTYLGTLAVVVVVTQAMGEEPLLVAIEMLVVEINAQLFHAWLQQVEVPSFRVGAGCADDLDARTLLAKHLDEAGQSLRVGRVVLVVPLLVADGQELEVERSGVSHLGTQFAPCRSVGTIGKLNQIDGILDVWVEVFNGHMIGGFAFDRILELAGHAAVEHGERFGSKIFAELEILEEAKTIGLIVVGVEAVVEFILPAVEVQGAVLDGTNCVFPLITIGEVGTFDDAATRETEDAGMQIIKSLSQVLTHATGAVLPRLGGEETHMLKVDAWTIDGILWFLEIAVAQEDAEHAVLAGSKWGEVHFVLFPFVAFDCNLGRSQLVLIEVERLVADLYLEICLVAGFLGHTGIDGELIGLALLDRNAKEALVFDGGMLDAMA